jgi:DNA-binding transcriptional MerR regulator
MPRHRTPHPTDGDGIGRKLTGVALGSRLKTLADEANKHHAEVQARWKGLLDHAQLAGEALIEAKRRLGHRTKWSKWRRDHFEGSKETACHYMRVARHWDDPRIQQAKASGMTIDSINKFLQVLRGQAHEPRKDTESNSALREMEMDFAREQLRKEFAEKLRKLDYQELKVLGEQFDRRSWQRLYKDLQRTVCQVTESDYYKEEAASEKRQVRSKVSNALNGKRRNRQLTKSRS